MLRCLPQIAPPVFAQPAQRSLLCETNTVHFMLHPAAGRHCRRRSLWDWYILPQVLSATRYYHELLVTLVEEVGHSVDLNKPRLELNGRPACDATSPALRRV